MPSATFPPNFSVTDAIAEFSASVPTTWVGALPEVVHVLDDHDHSRDEEEEGGGLQPSVGGGGCALPAGASLRGRPAGGPSLPPLQAG